MNIIKNELNVSLKSTLIWSAAILFILVSGFTELTAYYGNDTLTELFDAMPKEILAMFQMNSLDMTTVIGFMGIFFTFTSLILASHAAMLGGTLISKEEINKTSDFVLSLPVSRLRFIISKITAGLIILIVINLITTFGTIANTLKFEVEDNFFEFLLLFTLAHFLIQVMFFSVGVAISSSLKKSKKVSQYSMAVIAGMYFLSIIQPLVEEIEFLKYITPFLFFNMTDIVSEFEFTSYALITSILVVVISLILGIYKFQKRDFQN